MIEAGECSALGAVGARPLIDVAVGVMQRADRAVLLGQRVPGKPYAGWWEFPGGKLEAGESVEHALARELHEELGVRIGGSHQWVVREHEYPHAHVRLWFRRIWQWSGEPHSREGQSLAWLAPDAVDVAPLLPATLPVLNWLRLPALYRISNAAELGVAGFLSALERALCNGAMLLQLREPTLGPREFETLFYRVRELCRQAGARLTVSSRHDPSYWSAADGVHLTSAALAQAAVRPPVPIVAASCHHAGDIDRAGALALDLAVLGPVMATASHAGATTLGWAGFAALAQRTRVPLYALGGMQPGDLHCARRAGAHGVATMRAGWT